MGISRIEQVSFGVEDVAECVRFFNDFGLVEQEAGAHGATFATPTGQTLHFRELTDPTLPPALEDGPTIREMIWGVDDADALRALGEDVSRDREVIEGPDGTLHFHDETGWAVGLRVAEPLEPETEHRPTNATGAVGRVNQPLNRYGRARPLRICHVALFIRTEGWQEAIAFYTRRLGFRVTDQMLDMGTFMQAAEDFDQHTLLLGHRADRVALNHLAYEVMNFDQVIEGGNHMVASGWKEARRLGRHTIGSNVFRFFHAPCGGRVEYAADMDRVDASYGPNIYEQRPPHHMWMLTTNGQKEEL